jgi:oligopeptide/dipeptide ABC transporter ATP-binding protein
MIAMTIANDPDVLIADEPTTALDVTIQAQVLDVLERVAEKTSSSILLITHDLGVVAGVADRVMVMYAGREAELGTVEEVFYKPSHPYTQGLLASLPRIDRRDSEKLHRIVGQPPSLIFVPAGCAFHPRCPEAELPGRCNTEQPRLTELSLSHLSACHFAERLLSEAPELPRELSFEPPPPVSEEPEASTEPDEPEDLESEAFTEPDEPEDLESEGSEEPTESEEA